MCYVKFEPTNKHGVGEGRTKEETNTDRSENNNVENGQNVTFTTKNVKPLYYYGDSDSHGLIYSYIVQYVGMHLLVAYAYYYWWTSRSAPTFIRTWFYAIFLHYIGIEIGISIGSHRLWAHRSYKATFIGRFLLMLAQTLAGQFSIFTWAWQHRVHHKWSDTDADPHNTKRGFFYVHIGWMMRKPHPHYVTKTGTLDFSDLTNDPIVYWQHRFYYQSFILINILATAVPVYYWGESWASSFFIAFVIRYFVTLHGTLMVNSAAHMFGTRPYNSRIEPSQNILVSFGISEGYHNYHHQYPFDYQSSEHGTGLNIGVHLINFMAKLGLAYDRRFVSDNVMNGDKAKASRDPRSKLYL